VVEVRDPLGVEDDASPLLLGAQVEVKVIGKPLKDVIEIPRSALHEDHIWVFSPEPARGQGELSVKPQDGVRSPSASTQGQTLLLGKLEVRPVKVLRRRADSVLIREGLAEDELVITSRLPTAVPGMLLRLAR
jgi:multidrug efflux pump subunit AcrA (membrane-fusion protein)